MNDTGTSLSYTPKITHFSGSEAHMSNEAFTPFVVGVQTIRGDFAIAHQPEIAVLSKGMKINVQPLVVDKDKLNIRCRITTSEIHKVKSTNLPGMNVTVQTPHASRNAISARCTVSPGQTLLIVAPKGDGKVFYYAVTSKWWPVQDAADGQENLNN